MGLSFWLLFAFAGYMAWYLAREVDRLKARLGAAEDRIHWLTMRATLPPSEWED